MQLRTAIYRLDNQNPATAFRLFPGQWLTGQVLLMFSGKSEDMLPFTDSNFTFAFRSSGIRKSMAPLTVCTFSLAFQLASPDGGVDGSVYGLNLWPTRW